MKGSDTLLVSKAKLADTFEKYSAEYGPASFLAKNRMGANC